MATQFSFTCPHCKTRGAGFQIAFQWSDRSNSSQANLLAICGVCDLGITVKSYSVSSSTHANLTQHTISYPGQTFRMLRTWPVVDLGVPAGAPPNVGHFYLQGLENLHAGRWDAAGAMFRKALDVGTKILDPSSKNLTLFKRIDDLSDKGLITEAMRDWSHEIRLDGNDAVHDEQPETPADAAAMQKFTEAFLTYAFSLPTMVAENRAKRLPVTTIGGAS